jgi:hypothetical protein
MPRHWITISAIANLEWRQLEIDDESRAVSLEGARCSSS